MGLHFEQLRGKPHPLAHIDINPDAEDFRNLAWILAGARRVSADTPGPRRRAYQNNRLTMALLGPELGRHYASGFGLVTTLADIESAMRQAAGDTQLPRELRGIEVEMEEVGRVGPLWRFFLIISQGMIEAPWDVEHVWIEQTEYRIQ